MFIDDEVLENIYKTLRMLKSLRVEKYEQIK